MASVQGAPHAAVSSCYLDFHLHPSQITFSLTQLILSVLYHTDFQCAYVSQDIQILKNPMLPISCKC